MNPYPFLRTLAPRGEPETNDSCLTINIAGAPLGLSNLLDLVEHDISIDYRRQVHRLKFRSGEELYVHSDRQGVTVRGSVVDFEPDTDTSDVTVIRDPGARR
jgi:hypothetical protein